MKSKPSAVTSETKAPRLRVGLKDVDRDVFSAAVRERLGKQRVSIMLDGGIIANDMIKRYDQTTCSSKLPGLPSHGSK